MPKRVIDFDAMWGSDKLAACAAWAQAEYAWLYGLADASGCFELTNLRVIWGRVAAVRGNFTIERLEQVFAEFQDKGLLFVREYEGKRYGHWTGSDVPGRLPPPSWRMRLEKFAPPVPKQQLAEYMARFARGRAALAGVGFRGEAQRESFYRKEDLRFAILDLQEKRGSSGHATGSQMIDPRLLVTDRGEDRGYHSSNLKGHEKAGDWSGNSHPEERQAPAASGVRDVMCHERRDFARENGLKERLEGAQAQDLGLDVGLDLNGNLGVGGDERQSSPSEAQVVSVNANRGRDLATTDSCNSNSQSNAKTHAMSPKELAVARELRVGQGPVCGPARVRPEVLERVRRREAARAGSRSP
jgi:hypothetical protein